MTKHIMTCKTRKGSGGVDKNELAEALVSARITGEVATPREDNLAKIEGFVAGGVNQNFGVTWTRPWDFASVFELMVDRVGINADPSYLVGPDTISTAKCVAKLEEYREVLRSHVARGSRILFATAHPAGLLPLYAQLRQWALANGAHPAPLPPDLPNSGGGVIRDVLGVATWHLHGSLMHTHLPEHMRDVISWYENSGLGLPDLVVADHGWAGVSADAGLPTIGFADCNDPGLFVSEAQGQVKVAVPLDDNVDPRNYQPALMFLTE